MSFRFKCKECKEFIYLEELKEWQANYPCSNCNTSNFMTPKQAIKHFNIEEIDEHIDCPNCNKLQNIHAIFCKDCGTEISPKELVTIAYCEKCESEFDESYQFCEKDGNALVYKDKEIDGNPDIESDSVILNNVVLEEKIDENLGFGWGKFLIFMVFFQGSIAFIFGFLGGIETEYIPNKGVALLISVIALGSAFGLYQRRLYGLYVLYFSLIINIFFGLIAVYEGDEFYQFGGIFAIIISVLWGMYFKKREAMFT